LLFFFFLFHFLFSLIAEMGQFVLTLSSVLKINVNCE